METESIINFHRPFGVYGLLEQDKKLLVINKNCGPYINRYDLPGGSLEERETLAAALKREFMEETGLYVEVVQQIGAFDFMVNTNWREGTLVHHIAIFYLVRKLGGSLIVPDIFEGQDSLGTAWVSKDDVDGKNASPLVLKAFDYLRTNAVSVQADIYDKWEVKL